MAYDVDKVVTVGNAKDLTTRIKQEMDKIAEKNADVATDAEIEEMFNEVFGLGTAKS